VCSSSNSFSVSSSYWQYCLSPIFLKSKKNSFLSTFVHIMNASVSNTELKNSIDWCSWNTDQQGEKKEKNQFTSISLLGNFFSAFVDRTRSATCLTLSSRSSMVSSVGNSATIAAAEASRALPLLVSSDLASFSKPSPFLEISSFERVSQFLDLTLTAGTSLILFCGTTFSAKFQIEKKKKNLQNHYYYGKVETCWNFTKPFLKNHWSCH